MIFFSEAWYEDRVQLKLCALPFVRCGGVLVVLLETGN